MIKTKYKLDPAKYEFIFKVNNFDYFFFYFVLESEYSKWDFIFTNKGKEWKAYLGLADFKKVAKIGLELMRNDKKLDEYQEKAKFLIKEAGKVLADTKKIDFSELSNKNLSGELVKISHFVIKLWSLYFFTELFCYGEVERILETKTGSQKEKEQITKNVRKMQRIKYNFREQINKTIFGSHIFTDLVKEASKRLKIKIEDIYNLSYNEIIEYLKGEKYEREDREEYVVGQFSKWNLIVGKEAKAFIEILENYHARKISNVLTGQIGNKGRYIGRVKIINLDLKLDHIREISKMNKGDVLVSGSTGPEMILACRKAGAIVTEEGGITSHAAIVSRELGIPAVTGTKIATEVLHDGDLVEVDADHGIVKIIKNKNRK